MPIPLSPRAQDVVARTRAFVDRRIIPLETELLAKGWMAILPELRAIREEVKAAKLWAPFLPAEHGGLGLSLLEYAYVSEALGRSLVAHYCFNCQAPDVGNMELLISHGSHAQKERFLAPLTRGDIRSCFGMTEPEHAGSNPVWMSTIARRDGDSYVIDGHKWFTTGADGASFCIVMAVTDPDAPLHGRASQIIVPTDTPGFRIVRNISVMGDPGADHPSHSEVVLENVRVPTENLLGPEGAGFLLAQERLGPGRIHHCMRWIGICDRVFGLMCERAATRELSPGKPLGTQQQVQFWIAESAAEIHAARLLVIDCAERIDATSAHEAREHVSMIKFHVANVLQQVLDRALQIHGALGMTDDTPIAAWWRHERAARIYDGPDEVHKASLAKRILARHGMASKKS
ncbi:MAG: acyl-CoA dehydrogenase family protein [Myxococcota bacterium]|nr:acyl-CoA dehydrogenase family protein [Myxococcota bacterium]